MKDISYVAAMGKAGGGRNATDPRFLSLFSVFNMCFPSDESGWFSEFLILLAHQSDSRHLKTSLSSQDLCIHPFRPSSAIFRCCKVGFRYYYIGYIGPLQENCQRFATYAIQISLHF